jgi:NADH-quinone oxidoreductase subunit L
MSLPIFLIPLLPLLGAILNALVGRKLPGAWVAAIAVGSITLAFGVAVLDFIALLNLPPDARNIHQDVYTWIAVGQFNVHVSFLLDPLSTVMILVVTGVGALIHLYSVGYMAAERDEGYARFFTYMNLFAFSMLLLVLADNYLVLYVGWELVGLCSYLLIGFWFTRDAARSAAVKAFVVNRVGDFGFALGIILIFWTFGTLNYADVFTKATTLFTHQGIALTPAVGAPVVTIITLLLFMGATGKSAQIPLYVWLPDAMEGPTPVSALIHAATMVTAGVYMVARSHVLFSLAPTTLQVVAIIGTLTAFFAATIALVQTDLKRLLAYSTISQLGYMFLALGVGAFGAGIFHLMTHAFFKALLFLGAGSVMHAMNNVIDLRRLGGLRRVMPLTYATFAVGALALAGVPLFSGFFSKDEILSSAFLSGNYFLWVLGLLTAALTGFYIVRGVYLTFGGVPRWQNATDAHGHAAASESAHAHENGLQPDATSRQLLEYREGDVASPHESPPVMTIPLLALAVLAFLGGYVGLPSVLGPNWFANFVAPVFGEAASEAAPTLEWTLIVVSTLAAFGGIGLAYWFYVRAPSIPIYLAEQYHGVYDLLVRKYYVDDIYEALIARPARWVANVFWQVFDRGIIDGAANGLAGGFALIGRGLRRVESGYARAYALAMLVGIVIVIFALVIH